MNLTHKIKSSTVTLLLLSSMMLSAQASGDGTCHGDCKCPKRTYLRVDVGGSVLEYGKLSNKYYGKRFDPSIVGVIGAGYEITNKIKTDFTVSKRVEYYYKWETTNKQSLSNIALMLSGYYSIIDSTFSPYLMVGLGAAINTAGNYMDLGENTTVQGKTVTNFAWQAGAGLVYKFCDSIHLDLGYRYIAAGTAKTSDTSLDNDPEGQRGYFNPLMVRMKSHECTIGLIYKF